MCEQLLLGIFAKCFSTSHYNIFQGIYKIVSPRKTNNLHLLRSYKPVLSSVLNVRNAKINRMMHYSCTCVHTKILVAFPRKPVILQIPRSDNVTINKSLVYFSVNIRLIIPMVVFPM